MTGDSTSLRRWATALLLGTASFLVLFDSLGVATALPSIGASLLLGPADLQWVVSLYSLSLAAFLVLGGRLCDAWGRRNVLMTSLGLCAVAGLTAGLAPGVEALFAGRVLQGVSAAFAIPAALATAGADFEDGVWRSRVFAVIAFAAWSAGLGGAALGGVITDHLGWRWIFLVTVPVAALGCVGTRLMISADEERRLGRRRVDALGAFILCATLLCLVVVLQRLGDGAGLGDGVALPGVAAIVLGGVFVLVESRTREPLIAPGLLRSRRLVGCFLAFGAYCVGYNALVVVGSLYFQDVRGLSATQTGRLLVPVLVGGVVGTLLAPRLVRSVPSRRLVAGALAVCALSLTMIALWQEEDLAWLVPWLVLWGLASGPVYVGLTQECVGNAPPEHRGVVSALFESMSHVGGAVAVAFFLGLLGRGAGHAGPELIGAGVVAAGALTALLVVPGRRSGRSWASSNTGAYDLDDTGRGRRDP